MKNLVAQKWIDECGTLFPIDGNTVLYPTPGSGIFELYQGKGQDKRIGLKKLSEKFEFNHKIYPPCAALQPRRCRRARASS